MRIRRRMGGYTCEACNRIMTRGIPKAQRYMYFSCKRGDHIGYCNEYCAHKHNHRFRKSHESLYIKRLKRKVNRLKYKVKEYLSHLQGYGYGQS